MNREPVPLSALEHYCYCARQCALILVDGEWIENRHTVRGQRGHRRVDSGETKTERGRVVLRAITLWSTAFELTGRADAIEIGPDGIAIPIEYKIGTRHGDAADVQLCAQALCLEEMLGRSVPHGFVWYGAARRRHRVAFSPELRHRTTDVIGAVHQLRTDRHLPPAPSDQRCTECQLLDRCIPALVHAPHAIDTYLRAEVYQCGS